MVKFSLIYFLSNENIIIIYILVVFIHNFTYFQQINNILRQCQMLSICWIIYVSKWSKIYKMFAYVCFSDRKSARIESDMRFFKCWTRQRLLHTNWIKFPFYEMTTCKSHIIFWHWFRILFMLYSITYITNKNNVIKYLLHKQLNQYVW